MDLRPGYKQTEVGVIPEDWEVKQVGDLKPYVTSGSRGWAEFYSDRGSPFIRITNLSRDCIYPDLDDLRFVNIESNFSEAARTQLQNGDVLISITADIGIIGYVSANVPKPAYINQHIALVRFDSAQTNPRFVSYFLASEGPQKLFRALTDSGAKAGMNLTTVQQIHLALPSIKAEQEAIAEALSDADALIESLEQLLTKKRQLKQGAMQELLTGKKRLPGVEAKPGYKQTDMGAIPEDWEIKQVGDLKPFVTSGSRGWADFYSDRGSPFIRITNLSRGCIYPDLEDLRLVNLESNYSEAARTQLQDGDVLISITADIGIIGYVSADIAKPAYINQHIALVRFDSAKISSKFVSYFLASERPQKHFRALTDSGAKAGMNLTTVQQIRFALPSSKEEQTAIATILSDMDADISALEAKLTKARAIKQGMMQQLLTGSIRLIEREPLSAERGV